MRDRRSDKLRKIERDRKREWQREGGKEEIREARSRKRESQRGGGGRERDIERGRESR